MFPNNCMAMRKNNHFRIGLAELSGDRTEQLRFFALLNFGLVQSLAGGVMSAAEAVPFFITPKIASTFASGFEARRPMPS
jgi:hypothetical protein